MIIGSMIIMIAISVGFFSIENIFSHLNWELGSKDYQMIPIGHSNIKYDSLEMFTNYYMENSKNFPNIEKNKEDCDLFLSQQTNKFSCLEILDNACYKNPHNCYNISQNLNVSIGNNSYIVKETNIYPLIKNQVKIYNEINFYYNYGYFIFISTIVYFFSLGYCCNLCSGRYPDSRCCGFMCFLTPVIALIGLLIISLPFVSFHYLFALTPGMKNIGTEFNEYLKHPTTIHTNMLKPSDLKDVVMEYCPHNNWIKTDLHLDNCEYHFGTKICCINQVDYSNEGHKLIKYVKVYFDTINQNVRSHGDIVNNTANVINLTVYFSMIECVLVIIAYIIRRRRICHTKVESKIQQEPPERLRSIPNLGNV